MYQDEVFIQLNVLVPHDFFDVAYELVYRRNPRQEVVFVRTDDETFY